MNLSKIEFQVCLKIYKKRSPVETSKLWFFYILQSAFIRRFSIYKCRTFKIWQYCLLGFLKLFTFRGALPAFSQKNDSRFSFARDRQPGGSIFPYSATCLLNRFNFFANDLEYNDFLGFDMFWCLFRQFVGILKHYQFFFIKQLKLFGKCFKFFKFSKFFDILNFLTQHFKLFG